MAANGRWDLIRRLEVNIPEDLDLHSSRHDFRKWIIFVNTKLRWKQKQAAVTCCTVALAVLFQYLYPKSCMFEVCLLHLCLYKFLTFQLRLLFLLFLLLFLFLFSLSFSLLIFYPDPVKMIFFLIFSPNIRSANPFVHQLIQYKHLYRRNKLFKHYIS
jgi:hypothetical protein